MIDVTDKVSKVVFVQGEGDKGPWRRLDVEMKTLDGGTKRFSSFLREDQRRLCGLSDPEFKE